MNQLRRNVLTNYIARFSTVFALFFLFPYVAGSVGHSIYGVYLLISSMTVFFTLDFGMGTATIRYTAEALTTKDFRRLTATASSSLAFFAGLGALVTALFALVITASWESLNIADPLRNEAIQLVLIIGISQLLLGIPLGVGRQVLVGLGRLDLVNALQIGQLALRVALTVVVLEAGLGILAVAIVEGVLVIAVGALCVLLSLHTVPEMRLSLREANWTTMRGMIPLSGQLFVLSAAALVILQADNFLISLFLPVASVTLYGAAFRLYQVVREVTNALTMPLIPTATDSFVRDDYEHLRGLFLRGTAYSNGLMLACAVPAIVLAEQGLALWAGDEFREVATVVQILVLSQLVANNHLVALSVLTGIGKVGAYARYHGVWAISNIVLCVVLVGPLELEGIALGTAIPIVLLEPFYIRDALRQLGITGRRFAMRVLVRCYVPAALVAGPFWLATRADDPTGIVGVFGWSLAWVVAFGLAFWFTAVDRTDRAAAGRVISRMNALQKRRSTA